MASKKKIIAGATHRALRPIKHDGVFYDVDAELALSDDQADELGDAVAVLAAKEAE